MTAGTRPITATGIDCVCYLAKDFQRAKTFYQDVIGLKASNEGDNWTEFDLPDGTTFAIAKLPGDKWYPTGGVMFAVDDVYAALERMKSTGLPVYTSDVFETPVCYQAWGEDTEGNNFGVHKRK
jgi:predicted enzyme related to lactoylglutathione lyase